jgi:nucleotide-binding universal stress UspA family protein
MYDDILLPVDGATGATAVLHHAGALAHRTGATVRLLNVADTARDSVTVAGGNVIDALEREGEQVVEEAAETLETLGVEYATDVVQGSPAETIVDYATRYEYDLVAMATRGRGGLPRYLLGSVTEKVIRLSSVPVVTLSGEDERLVFPYERVLVATDGSRQATNAVGHAVELAAALDATVHALSVVDDTGIGPDVRAVLTEDVAERTATEAVEAVVDAAPAGVDVVTSIEHGEPATCVLEYVDANDAHAVVLGTTGRRGVDRVLLGSVAERTARASPVPVFTVRS